jgi:hypothetical protein
MDQITNIVDKIVELIEKSESNQLLGVRLGAALKASFPTFSPAHYQCKNLRQFVKKHVPRVIEKGHSGVDVLYTVSESTEPSPAVEPTLNAEDSSPIISLPVDVVPWRAYSNPSYPLTVVANPGTGEVKAIGQREQA